MLDIFPLKPYFRKNMFRLRPWLFGRLEKLAGPDFDDFVVTQCEEWLGNIVCTVVWWAVTDLQITAPDNK